MSQVAAGSEKADPLRQQLDELDQLMERMLALGVQSAPSEPPREIPGQPAAGSAELKLPAVQISEHSAEPEPPSPAIFEMPVETPFHPEFDVNLTTTEPAFASLSPESPSAEPELGPAVELALPAPTFVSLDPSSGVPAAPLFAEFQFAPPPSTPTLDPEPAPIVSKLFTRPPSPTVIVAWWLQPVALVNYVYDGSTRWLGPIGRGLRSRPMRNLLGICGLACVVGALAWMLWEGTDWNS